MEMRTYKIGFNAHLNIYIYALAGCYHPAKREDG